MKPRQTGLKIVATNRRARHDFLVEDTYEAGLVLQGTEVKSLRMGSCTIAQAYARPRGNEVYLFDMHIPPYEAGSVFNHEPARPRKLLLHRREVDRIVSRCTQRGYTLVPLSVYFRNGYAKVEIGLARRRRKWDDREKKRARLRREEARSELGRRRRR
jgi:SsrA-binding protein